MSVMEKLHLETVLAAGLGEEWNSERLVHEPGSTNSSMYLENGPFPWQSKDYLLNGSSAKTIVLVRVYNQQFQGTIVSMVFDFQGFEDVFPIENGDIAAGYVILYQRVTLPLKIGELIQFD